MVFWKGAEVVSGVGTTLPEGSNPVVVVFWKGASEVSGVGITLPEGTNTVAVVFWKGASEVSGLGTTLPEGVKVVVSLARGGTRKAEHMFEVVLLWMNSQCHS